jgi:uncharacterized protein YgiM (DUF1202 family)
VIAAAYFNAYVDLVHYMQANAQDTTAAAANAPIQAYTVSRPIQMHAGASVDSKTVRSFAQGDLVYPTGQRDGIWWQVDDENGNRGWVTSTAISPR